MNPPLYLCYICGFRDTEPYKMTDSEKTPNPEPKLSFEEWRALKRKGKVPLDERMKNSPYLAARLLYKTVRSIGMVFIAIGAFLAWLIGFLFL